MCTITGIGPVVNKPLNTRAQLNQHRCSDDPHPPIQTGSHYTLLYQQASTGEEHYSSVTEVLQWIAIGPPTTAHITQPDPGMAPVRHARDLPPHTAGAAASHEDQTNGRTAEQRVPPPARSKRVRFQPTSDPQDRNDPSHARDLRRQHRDEQRVHPAASIPIPSHDDHGETPIARRTSPRLAANMLAVKRHEPPNPELLARPMPKSTLQPLRREGPLNLNEDGTDISYRKSHAGPNAHHWIQADAEEMERLFTSGTIRPLHFPDIPADTVVTYVNPVCTEKLNDDAETLKLRTCITIGGDRINYPYDKSAVTANMEALKLLINAMISEDADWSTIDISDFYLGTPLPHPEYIRIQRNLIPPTVLQFYDLDRFLHRDALYCSVHK